MTAIFRRRYSLIAGVCSMVAATICAADDDVAPPASTPLRTLLEQFVSELVVITPGSGRYPKSFEMGSADGPEHEQPVHTVTLDGSFAISQCEVPQNLYEAVMGVNPSRWKGPRNSVEMVTRENAEQFCARLTQLLRDTRLIADTEEIRLPTESEWEYCCRAGTSTAYSFGPSAVAEGDRGNQATILDQYAWHTGNAAGNDPPVAALKPNPWGLHDMHGYLWELVADDWHADYRSAPRDGSVWKSDRDNAQRVLRGGSWREHYARLKSTSRQPWNNQPRDDVGFRCVKAPTRTQSR